MNASFEEKSVWITMLSLFGVFVVYFVAAGQMLAAGVTAAAPYLPLLLGTTTLFITILVVAHIVAAVAGVPEESDERDRLISCRAESNSSWLLAVFVLAAVFALAFPVAEAWVANGLLLGLFLSEILKHGLQIYYYRRGI